MKHLRVAVLRGGPSNERAVSMQTGAGVINALRSNGQYAKDVVIAPSAEWIIDGVVHTPERALRDIDVAFIALHGEYGEDGVLQRSLEQLHVPYTGSRPMPSAIALNKVFTKNQLKELGIQMPRHLRLTKSGVTDPARIAESIAKLFGPDYFVKPERGGSSIGTYLVKGEANLPGIIAAALAESEAILVEEAIAGKEATVGILEDFRNERTYVLPPVEIIPPAESQFFAADVKYTGATQEICPGNFSRSEKDQLMSIGKQVHEALGLRHYSRSDFMVANGEIYFLEVNTLPGLTAESLFPKAVDSVGASYTELINHLITLAHTTKG